MNENAILEKSYKFALRIVRLYKYLCEEKHEVVMTRQLLTAGTNIGAHVKEAQEAESKTVFFQEMGIALRKTSETEYWLLLLQDSGVLGEREFNSIDADRVELKKLLTKITKASKEQK